MKSRSSRRAASPIELIANAITALPGDIERDHLLKNIDAIITYFSGLKRKVESLPSSDERTHVLTALDDIAQFLSRSKENPVLATALGLADEHKAKRSSRPKAPSPQSAEELLAELKTLPTEEIQKRLSNYKHITMSHLNALAKILGLRYEERMKRQDLIDRIVKIGFANVRGYDLLRGPGPS